MKDTDIDEYIRGMNRIDDSLNKQVCPTCSGPLTRKLDPRQAGPHKGEGLWFNYRCAQCKYMCDRVEYDA